jgi:hypothetical protein
MMPNMPNMQYGAQPYSRFMQGPTPQTAPGLFGFPQQQPMGQPGQLGQEQPQQRPDYGAGFVNNYMGRNPSWMGVPQSQPMGGSPMGQGGGGQSNLLSPETFMKLMQMFGGG